MCHSDEEEEEEEEEPYVTDLPDHVDPRSLFLEKDGLDSTTSESEDEYIDYQAKTNRKIRFSRGPIKVGVCLCWYL